MTVLWFTLRIPGLYLLDTVSELICTISNTKAGFSFQVRVHFPSISHVRETFSECGQNEGVNPRVQRSIIPFLFVLFKEETRVRSENHHSSSFTTDTPQAERPCRERAGLT